MPTLPANRQRNSRRQLNSKASATRGLSLRLGCLLAFCMSALALQAQTLTTLTAFDGQNGDDPSYESLALGSNGNYYGTTLFGGSYGGGTVFEVTPSGTLTNLYNFCSQPNCADGVGPYEGLVLDSDGNFYGVTYAGGADFGGTVFRITPAGELTTIYNFCSQTNCADGSYPYAGLATASNGDLYGTTTSGGTNSAGTVFQITTAGKLTTLYNFCTKASCTDGSQVLSPLVRSSNGKYYGVTLAGGANNWGTVFDITTKGKLTTLHSFAVTDGAAPWGGLVQASDGNLYGTTLAGGNSDDGTVFKITKAGKLTTVYNFCALIYCPDGVAPEGTLIQGSNGSLYGTTAAGGTGNGGTVFEITTAGILTTLHSFVGTDGEGPSAGVVQGSNGDLYGTTYEGGNYSCTSPPIYGCGTVFSLTLMTRESPD